LKLFLQSQRTEILKILTFRILHPDFAESLVLFEKKRTFGRIEHFGKYENL